MPTKPALIASALALAFSIASCAWGGETPDEPRKLKADPTQEYYVYFPKTFDAKRTYYVFVAVHDQGGTGQGASGWAKFADDGPCIVLGPTFKGIYQLPSEGAGEKLRSILRELAKEYKIEMKVFLTGYGTGAQFAHRFALELPHLVLGCAAHSANSWSAPDTKARGVPFLITCGAEDRQGDRLGQAQKFVQDLTAKKFKVDSKWIPNFGHVFSDDAREKTSDFYLTLATGMTAVDRARTADELGVANYRLEDGKYAEAANLATKILSAKPSGIFVEKANAIMAAVEEAGNARLAKIDEQAKTDPEAAATELEKVVDVFEGTRIAAVAARRLKAMKSKTAAIEKEKVEEKEKAEAKAAAAPATEEAKARKMAADCRSWMRLADNFIANQKPGDAHRYLVRIIETYPNSEAAAKASRMLEELRKKR